MRRHISEDRSKHERAFALLIKKFGLPAPVCQFRFHPTRKWSADFAWPEHQLLVEIEGGIWRRGGGAHSHPLNIERDIEKHNAAVLLGFRTLRITDKMLSRRQEVETGNLLQKVLNFV